MFKPSAADAEVRFEKTFSERFAELVGDTPYRDLEDKLHISKSTISAYILGSRSPKHPVLLSIARVYGVDPLWLMGADVPKHKNETPAETSEGMSEDRAYLSSKIASLSDDDIKALRTIVDQVLSLRGK